MIKNRALALSVLAGIYARQGQHQKAAASMLMASQSPDFPSLVKATRQIASASKARTTASKPAARVRSSRQIASWPFSQRASVGEDMREEVDTNKSLREVQEAAIEDDLAMMGLDDGAGDEMVISDVDDFDPSSDFELETGEAEDDEDDEGSETAAADDEDDDEDDDKSETARATASMARALQNAAAQHAASAKKKAAKKKAVKK